MTMTNRAHRNRNVFAVLDEARLTSRDDRIMIANQILGSHHESFTDMSDSEMADLATALNDWRTIQQARSATGAMTVDAIEHLLNLGVPEPLRQELIALCESHGLHFTIAEDPESGMSDDAKTAITKITSTYDPEKDI